MAFARHRSLLQKHTELTFEKLHDGNKRRRSKLQA